jgi:hypothetical protein
MHRCSRRWVVLIGIALAVEGCGEMGASPSGADGPEAVVAEFLEAVRSGNDQRAAELLTPLARQRTAAMHMVVAPPGSPTAQYKLCGVEVAFDGARVAADWTDLDTDGRAHTDRITWLLRQQAEGWRIAGMSSQMFSDRPPVVLNFEDPAEMLRQQQLAEEEIARRDRQR